MSINYKDIIYKSKKNCAICKGHCYNNGVKILDKFICNECMDNITSLNCGDIMYDEVKNSIKLSLANKLKDI